MTDEDIRTCCPKAIQVWLPGLVIRILFHKAHELRVNIVDLFFIPWRTSVVVGDHGGRLRAGVWRIHRNTGRQQRTSGILELSRNQDERRPPLPTKEFIAQLGKWKGHRVGTVERFEPGEKGARAQVWIELLGFQDYPRVCSGCNRFVRGVHDWSQREIRDLPVFDADTVLVVWRARVACPACGPKLESLEWLEPHARVIAASSRASSF